MPDRSRLGASLITRKGSDLGKVSNHCLERTLELVEQMLHLADEGDAVRNDPGCGVLYGMLRDSAYKLKQLAEAERRAHRQKQQSAGKGEREGSLQTKMENNLDADSVPQG